MDITRRDFLLAGAALAAPIAARPNVVLIMADDMGYGDLSSYGCPDIRTPAIDSLGERGVRFTQFYANAPECTPSRTALLTGRYQQRVGGLECAIGVGNVGRYDDAVWLQQRGELGLPASETSFAQMLKRAGYDTACFGKWHLGYLDKFSPNRHGFDEYLGILGGNADYFRHTEPSGERMLYHNGRPIARDGEYLTELIGREAVRWLRDRTITRRPFFLYLPFTVPHDPHQSPRGAAAQAGHEARAIYAEMVESMDQQVANVLAELDRMGAAQNTLVVFMSDNGGTRVGRNHPFRGTKSTCWEGGIRVPCLLRWPARLSTGREVGQTAIMMDMTATILAAAGVKPARKLDGMDLLPLLRADRPAVPRTLFWRYRRAENVRKAVLDGAMKYVFDNGREELHDLSADLEERHDLLAARADAAERLRKKLAEWEREIRAPRLKLLHGRYNA